MNDVKTREKNHLLVFTDDKNVLFLLTLHKTGRMVTVVTEKMHDVQGKHTLSRHLDKTARMLVLQYEPMKRARP